VSPGLQAAVNRFDTAAIVCGEPPVTGTLLKNRPRRTQSIDRQVRRTVRFRPRCQQSQSLQMNRVVAKKPGAIAASCGVDNLTTVR
jgi:hypothetical protein